MLARFFQRHHNLFLNNLRASRASRVSRNIGNQSPKLTGSFFQHTHRTNLETIAKRSQHNRSRGDSGGGVGEFIFVGLGVLLILDVTDSIIDGVISVVNRLRNTNEEQESELSPRGPKK